MELGDRVGRRAAGEQEVCQGSERENVHLASAVRASGDRFGRKIDKGRIVDQLARVQRGGDLSHPGGRATRQLRAGLPIEDLNDGPRIAVTFY